MSSDRVVRALTEDGAFRVMVAQTTETVREATHRQGASGRSAQWLADLMTSAILIRETMAPTLRVQAIMASPSSSGRIIADSHPDGGTRGLIQASSKLGSEMFPKDAVLQIMRSLPNGQPHTGVIEVKAPLDVSKAVMVYFQESEQVLSMVSVASIYEHEQLVAAGGFVVQLLPELTEQMLAIMTERLKDFESIGTLLQKHGAVADVLMDEILYGMPHTRVGDSSLSFMCRCSADRLLASLATLPATDRAELAASKEMLSITCDYCLQTYEINPATLKAN